MRILTAARPAIHLNLERKAAQMYSEFRKIVGALNFEHQVQTPSRKINMKKQIFKTSLVVAGVVAMLSGCSTTHDTQQTVPANAVQSNTGPTVSGYIDVGAGKSFH
jgi:hypothetical protein